MGVAVNTITKNMEIIQEQIYRAARSAGRESSNVRLVVVTKAQPVEVVRAVIDAGAQILGENYPEETVPKMEKLGQVVNVSWHMIGHLQSRKASLVATHFDALHSLDSIRLAEKLEKHLIEIDRVLPVMLEINIGGEESKHGWIVKNNNDWEMLRPDVERIIEMKHLRIVGLMTMPPLVRNPEDARPYFQQVRELGDFLSQYYGQERFSEFSMGTSADFETAVQEGATLVRIGQAIVGPRPLRAGN